MRGGYYRLHKGQSVTYDYHMPVYELMTLLSPNKLQSPDDNEITLNAQIKI